ncbi:hypothetical protein AAFF_G00007150 [Aldrovandia affinis]|uniref:Uncharacterized protein n=1 Tax=Aldrovandia affinis TaxID=143900 RepID=A0AAD7WZJ8_9TELE|nr:hypothetical protein AAFF_G00007150 [Aldrovandia affinis]
MIWTRPNTAGCDIFQANRHARCKRFSRAAKRTAPRRRPGSLPLSSAVWTATARLAANFSYRTIDCEERAGVACVTW